MSKVAKIAAGILLLLSAGWLSNALAQAGATPEQEVAAASNSVETLQASQQGADVVVKLTFKQPLPNPPASFTIATPARIAVDFPSTANRVGQASQSFNLGELRSANLVQVGDRTRLVLNLSRLVPYETRLEGNAVYLTLTSIGTKEGPSAAPVVSNFAESRPSDVPHSIRDINFRRGKDGEGRVIVELADSNTGIDIRQQGSNLIVDFLKTSIDDKLKRKLDVTDFATPITSVTTVGQGDRVRIVVTPRGLWEHNAYQSDNQFVLEVKPLKEDPNKLVQGSRPGYQGEKLSLNFQNVDVRAVLQVIADFTNFNIITSDTVSGSLTLRLKDVPWDQALDIILQAKGLDKRKNGNVIWIAPRDELAAKEKIELESRQQVSDLEPVRTESFQLNYHRAKAIFDFLKNKDQTMLSKRGAVIVDERTNKLFVTDAPSRLDDVRRLIAEIDVPVRQVSIEARIVEAEDTFSRNLGSRLGFNWFGGRRFQILDESGEPTGRGGSQRTVGGGILDTGWLAGQIVDQPDFLTDRLGVNLPAAGIAGKQAGQFSFVLYNSKLSRVLNFEISALEADGKGKVISSPRVVTADQVEAIIESGVEIPYQQATSSGATSVSFRKANLALKVKPQITPDGRVMLALDVNKDTPNTLIATGAGVAIDTKHVKTEVLVENGGTVVIGGIFTQEDRTNVSRIPFLGDLPYVGFLFKTTERRDNKNELLIFVTPKVVSEALTLR